ncbi:peptidoglycan-binding domain-containing protein [Streptomyces zagrosensis]|uniref:Peptidoglycan binding-like domain-containing protein n=1 Tax=Streptomyces zagrosensis TaxID=1042984 RepID=A0A7W9Q408_9ACTN|nr:peptidoglycan-binding domain-containing protein [Streptomyces zagrosensis]MBB5933221.1 hypothetical protein [Streptomyces zagrosensis]
MTGELCPHCFAPPRADGRPGCTCAARTGDRPDATATTALHGISEPARSGEQHPADEPPLGGTTGPGGALAPDGSGPHPEDLMLFADEPPPAATGSGPGPDSAGPDGEAHKDGTGGTDGAGGAGDETPDGRPGGRAARPVSHRRRRPVAIVLVAAAIVAVLGTLAFGTGLLGGDGGDDDRGERALPDAHLASPSEALPTWDGKMTSSATPPPSGTATTSPSASPSATRSGSQRPSPKASATPDGRSGAPHASDASTAPPATRPSPTESTGEVGDPPQPPNSPSADPPKPSGPPVLREGDSGPEVAELQDRLRQTWTYGGAADGAYDAGVTDAVHDYQSRHDLAGDPEGVYGPRTRAYLEARTDEP